MFNIILLYRVNYLIYKIFYTIKIIFSSTVTYNINFNWNDISVNRKTCSVESGTLPHTSHHSTDRFTNRILRDVQSSLYSYVVKRGIHFLTMTLQTQQKNT